MPSAGQMQVVLSANAAQLYTTLGEAQKGLRATEAQGNRTGAAIMRAGDQVARAAGKIKSAILSVQTAVAGAVIALGATKFIGALDAAAEKIDQLGKASKRLGVSVQELSAFRFAAGEAGIEFDQLAKLSGKALREVSELVAGGTASIRIGRLNVQLTDSAGKVRSLSQLLPDLARGLESVESEADQLRLAEKFFGRGGGEDFMTLLKDSGGFIKSLGEQTERARRLGVIFTDDQVRKLTDYRDAVGRVHEAWLGVKVKIATDVAPFMTEFLNDLAARTAQIPRTIEAVVKGFGISSGTGEEARRVGTLLERSGQDTVALLTGGAKAAGEVFVAVVKGGVRVVGTAMAIEFAEGLRNVLPQGLKSAIGLDVQIGDEAKIRKLQQQIGALRNVEATYQNRASHFGENSLETLRFKERLDRMIVDTAGHGKTIEQAIRVLQRQIEQEQNVLAMNEGAKGQLVATITRQAGEDVAKALTDARESLSNLFEKADASRLEMVTGILGPEAANGLPPPTDPRSPVNFFSTLAASIGEAGAAASASRPAVESLYSSVMEGIRKAYDFSQDLQVRNLLAGGDRDTADRLKMQNDQFRERRKLIEDLGGATAGLVKSLEQTHSAELKAFDSNRLDELREKLKGIRFEFYPSERLEAELENLKKILQAGLITQGVYDDLAKKIEEKYKKGADESETFTSKMQRAIEGFADGASDSFAAMVVDGKTNFEELANSWAKTLLSMAVKKFVFQPFFNAIGSFFGPAPTPAANAHGNAFNRGRIVPFARGGVLDQPALFPMALAGEAGPEAILPLTRVGGDLGVRASGGGTLVQIVDQRSGGARPQVSENSGPDGRKQIRIIIRDEVRAAIASGSLDRAMNAAFGSNRVGTVR